MRVPPLSQSHTGSMDILPSATTEREGGVRFEALPPPTQEEVERLLRWWATATPPATWSSR